MKQVDGHPDLYRDETTNAILNSNSVGYDSYKQARKKRLDQQTQIDNIVRDIDDIKSLLNQIIKKL